MLALVTAVCGTIALLVSLVEKSGHVQHRMARIWARGCVWASWSRVTVVGAENLRKHPVAVYASNHTSYMDTPVIFASLPFQFRILAKKSLWQLAIHRMVAEALRADADRHRESACDAVEPGRRCEGAARGNAVVCFSRRWTDNRRRVAAVSVRRGIPGDSCAGAAGADCAQWCVRPAANSHAPLLSQQS